MTRRCPQNACINWVNLDFQINFQYKPAYNCCISPKDEPWERCYPVHAQWEYHQGHLSRLYRCFRCIFNKVMYFFIITKIEYLCEDRYLIIFKIMKETSKQKKIHKYMFYGIT